MCLFVHRTPVDKWVIPWVNVLGSAVSAVFPDIRRKMAKALDNWDALDHSALFILKPWKGNGYTLKFFFLHLI